MAAKNANVSWLLNFRVRMFLKSQVNTCASEGRKKNQYLTSLLYLTFMTDLSFISHSLLKALASHLTPTQYAYFKASKYYSIQ